MDFCLMDIKEGVVAAATHSPNATMPQINGERVVEDARHLSPFLGSAISPASHARRANANRHFACCFCAGTRRSVAVHGFARCGQSSRFWESVDHAAMVVIIGATTRAGTAALLSAPLRGFLTSRHGRPLREERRSSLR